MTTTEDHGPAHDTAGPLPRTGRLRAVLASTHPAATDALEYATQLLGTLWGIHLAAADMLEIAAVDSREIVEADVEHVGHQHRWQLPPLAVGWSRTLTQVIDDEVSRRLGNRADAAILVDDDLPEIVTAGSRADAHTARPRVPRPHNPTGLVLLDRLTGAL